MGANKITMNTEKFEKDFVLEIDGVEFTLEELVNIKKESSPLEFNEENIRKIAEECFNNYTWYKYILKQYENTEMRYRKDINKNNFIDDVVKGCIDGKVMHLTREWHRGISKSHFIKRMAKEFNLPIFSPVFSEYNNFKYDNNRIYTNIDQLKGIKFDKILADECSVEMVNKIRRMGIKPIGFTCTYKNYELI